MRHIHHRTSPTVKELYTVEGTGDVFIMALVAVKDGNDDAFCRRGHSSMLVVSEKRV